MQAIPQQTIIPRPEHSISRDQISEYALKVLYRLKKADYEAYLVGGGVRDLLLGREPKDFDVATDATPEQVRKLFRNCRLIGRRFRLAHVHFGREIIEVATFRADHVDDRDGQGESVDGRLVRDNVYGNLEEDAVRRDFTINALYYNIRDFSLVDYSDGLADLQAGVLRLIGDPETRLREDPVRMLRAVRFAAKLGFRIHPDLEEWLPELAQLLEDIPPARLYEEVLKLFHGGSAVEGFELLRHYGLFEPLFPDTEDALAEEEEGFPRLLIAHALESTDRRINQGLPVTPAFLFAALLWEPMHQYAQELQADGMNEVQAIQVASADIIAEQVRFVALPKRFSVVTREIWSLQSRFSQRGGKRPARLMEHPRFRAAYDFLLLRAEEGGELRELADWWTRFQEVDEEERGKMTQGHPGGGRGRGRRRRRTKAKAE